MNFEELNRELTEEEKPHGPPAWLLSFIDLISLVFAFFVLMYSTKDMPQEKFDQIRNSFVKYINGQEEQEKLQPLQVLDPTKIVMKNSTPILYLESVVRSSLRDNENMGISVTASPNMLDVSFEEEASLEELGDKLTEKLILLSKSLNALSNQIEVRVDGVDIDTAITASDIICSRIEELGYERKILRSLTDKNLISESVEKNKNKLNIHIIIRAYETIF